MGMKDFFRMSHWYIARWRAARNPTTLTKGGLAVFEVAGCPELHEYATNLATRGVLPMGDKVPVRFKQTHYSPTDDNAGKAAFTSGRLTAGG